MTDWLRGTNHVHRLPARLGGLLVIVLASACTAVPSEEPGLTEDRESALAEDYAGDRGGQSSDELDEPSSTSVTSDDDRARALESAPARVVLAYAWKGQETGYWCGPGSTRIALSTRLDPTALPSETTLARELGTTHDGTVRADLVRVLNEHLKPPAPYTSIPIDTIPTQAERERLTTNLVARLSSGYPIVANVLSGWRPAGYPRGTIGHFVAIVGYEQNGERVLVADPAAEGSAGPRWVDVPRAYWISIQDLGTWSGGRGYSG